MTMLSRISGMVRDMIYLDLYGANAMMDAFLVAFRIPNFLRRLFAEGAFAQAFVPVLSEYKVQRGDKEVKLLVNKLASALTLVLGGLAILAMAGAPWVIDVFAPGYHAYPQRHELASSMLKLTFPYLPLISLTAFSGAILNSYGRFWVAGFTPVLLNLCMIATAWWLSPLLAVPIKALAWGVLIAGVIQLLFQIPFLAQIHMLPRWQLDWQDEGVRRVLRLMVPALFGVSVSQINLLLDTVLATFLPAGSVSWLYTAERLTELPLGLIGIAVGTVILPSLSNRHAEADHHAFAGTLDWAMTVVVMVGVPASLAMQVLAEPMLATLFMHGHFSAMAVEQSAAALRALSGGILAFMLIKVLAPGFYSRQDTRTPVRIGIIAMVANMAFNLMLVWHFKHVGLAMASTLAAFVNAGLLYRGLHQRGVYRLGGHWRRLLLQFGFANVGMVIFLEWLLPNTAFWLAHGWHYKLLILMALILAGALVYFLLLAVVGVRIGHLRFRH
ncbi:MAG: murein biosynthesis integral membrane protein MurJ [Pseudomonadales bacterium]|nr:murein biosynthesis integral membrane protein MurJ [Pseudomonadales bacterium]